MLVLLSFAILGIGRALAQASYSGSSFTYWGCASVDAAGFGEPIVFLGGTLTPEACQAACEGQLFAAVSPYACRCGNDPTAIISLDESACNYPCAGDPRLGMCGGICPKGGPGISNVFTSTIILISEQDPPSEVQEPDPAIVPPTGPLITSGPPRTDSSALSNEPSTTFIINSPPEGTIPPPINPPDSSTSSISVPLEPPSVTPTTVYYSTRISTVATFSVSTSPTSSPVFRTPRPPPPGAKESSSQSVAWPDPSDTVETVGDPPIPSVVTTSDSGYDDVSILITLGEVLLIVAMVF